MTDFTILTTDQTNYSTTNFVNSINTHLNNNNNNMQQLEEWLQAEFQSKVHCNLILNYDEDNKQIEENQVILNDYGINIYLPNSHTIIQNHIQNQNIKDYLVTSTATSKTKLLKIELPNKRNSFVTTVNFKIIENEPTHIDKPNFIYVKKMKSVDIGNGDYNPKKCPIAIIDKNNLIILWTFNERNSTNIALMKYLIDSILKTLKTDHILFPNISEKNKNFIKAITSFQENSKQQIMNDLSNARSSKDSYLRDYLNQTKLEETCMNRLKANSFTIKNIEKKAKNAIKYFEKNKKLKEWRMMTEDKIQFIFNNLHMEYKEVKIKLPEYKVTLNLTEGSFIIDINEGKYDNINFVHPHAFEGGRVCMGNFATIYPRIVASGNFNQIVDIMIQFLENYNEESPVIKFWKFAETLNQNLPWSEIENKEELLDQWIIDADLNENEAEEQGHNLEDN